MGTCMPFRSVAGSSATQPAATELALAGGGVDIPLAAFGFDIGEPFLYQYDLLVPWKIECRIEAPGLIRDTQPVTCLVARGDPPDEDLAGPAAYPQWRMDSDPAWVLHLIEELLDEDLDDECFRAEACEIRPQLTDLCLAVEFGNVTSRENQIAAAQERYKSCYRRREFWKCDVESL
jgi:hypothetical protein